MTHEWRTTGTSGNRAVSVNGYRGVLFQEGEGDATTYGFGITYGAGPTKFSADYATAKEAQDAADIALNRVLRLLEIAHMERLTRKRT